MWQICCKNYFPHDEKACFWFRNLLPRDEKACFGFRNLLPHDEKACFASEICLLATRKHVFGSETYFLTTRKHIFGSETYFLTTRKLVLGGDYYFLAVRKRAADCRPYEMLLRGIDITENSCSAGRLPSPRMNFTKTLHECYLTFIFLTYFHYLYIYAATKNIAASTKDWGIALYDRYYRHRVELYTALRL